MSIESDIFQRKKPRFGSLEAFGFIKDGDVYKYTKTISGGDMIVEVSVGEDGAVISRVVETDTDEEYLPVKIPSFVGAYVGDVRREYSDELERIASCCFDSEQFIFPQSNRIARLIKEKYGEEPDYPFSTAKSYAVFRYPKNKKWYALLADIREYQLYGEKPDDKEKSPVIEVINLKTGEEGLARALEHDGIYPAYHMNHKSWISVVLNDTVPDETIAELIDASRAFAVGSAK